YFSALGGPLSEEMGKKDFLIFIFATESCSCPRQAGVQWCNLGSTTASPRGSSDSSCLKPSWVGWDADRCPPRLEMGFHCVGQDGLILLTS
uniref:Uncharacterized protein n=1 Tax=Astyanax mexicanus TaxID=7994 RepID=A0A3B1JKY9_ASTMX